MHILTRLPPAGPVAAATAMALCLAATMPAAAQTLSASEAWAGIQSLAEGAGLSITSTSLDDTGTAVTASGVRITPSADPGMMAISMETLRIEPRGERVALIPSADILVDTRGTDGIARQFQITHDGEISGMVSEESAALDLGFPSLTATLVSGAAPAVTPVPGKNPPAAAASESFSLEFDTLDASLSATLDGDAQVALSAAQVSYELSYTESAGGTPSPVSMTGLLTSPELTFDGSQLALLSDEPGMLARAFAAGLSAHLSFSAGPSSGSSTQTVEGMPVSVSSEGGASSLTASLAEGRFDAEISADAGRMDGNYGPVAGNVSFDGMGLVFGMPLVVTPDDQPARYAFRFENVTPSPELLAMVGAGEFTGDSITLALDLGAQARLTRELDMEVADSDVPPFEVSTISLDDLRIAVGDAELNGTGAVALIGGLAAQIDRDRPEAEGDFVFNLIGGNRLLTRLQNMGLVPSDQLFFVRMMLNGLGRSVGEDHLVSDVAIRPGGVVTVNGAPLPF